MAKFFTTVIVTIFTLMTITSAAPVAEPELEKRLVCQFGGVKACSVQVRNIYMMLLYIQALHCSLLAQKLVLPLYYDE